MLNLNQSSLMIEGSLRGILSSQEGKSFEEIISFSKYIMEENKVAKLSEEIYKPDVEMNVDGIVDILITNIEMKWTEDDVYKIEEKDLFTDISKMNERNAVKVNNELARKRVLEIIGDDPLEAQKYLRIFIQRLYKETRQSAGLGSKVARTTKCDYQRCIDYIEAWIPSCGCASLRAKADANAKARLEARKLGYTN